MNSDRPQVSIITPSLNQAEYLEIAIRSVLDQDYVDLEYILVDGGSTDGSVGIIKKYAEHLSWWVSERDEGQAEAINKGMVHAHGDILAWLNSDDYYLPGAVRSAVRTFQDNPEILLVYGNMLAVDEVGQVINLLEYHQLSFEDLLCFQIIGQPTVFFRREALERAGKLDLAYHYLLDHHLWLRIAMQGKILHVDETWAAARFHAKAKNRARAAEFGQEAFKILEWVRNQPGLAETIQGMEKRLRASAFRVDARYLLDGGRPGQALVSWFRALILHPLTALARLNILVSAFLQISGLGKLREIYLRRRRANLRRR